MIAPTPRILITRPEPGATRTASKLRALGFEPVVLPFTEMVGLPVDVALDQAQQLSGIVVTSANALRYLSESMLKALRPMRLFAVGDATADTARALGFINVISADGNAADLCSLVLTYVDESSSVLYLCGVTRTDDVETVLLRSGLGVRVVETYKTQKVSQLTYKLSKFFDENSIAAVCFYSSVSAEIFGAFIIASKTSYVSDINKYFCISERAKDKLPEGVKDNVLVCDKPRDDTMVRLISDHFSL